MCLCAAEPRPAALSATEKYWRHHILDYGDAIAAVFYDGGRHLVPRDELPSLMQLRSMHMDSTREIILVNYAEDRELQAFSVSALWVCA